MRDKLTSIYRIRKLNKLVILNICFLFLLVNPSIGLDKSTKLIGSNILVDFSLNGQNNTICLIDTGVDYMHENLGNCNNISNCDRILGGYNFINNNSDPLDDSGHGTEVAGIILSNHSKYRGIAPSANLVILKALDSNGEGTWKDINASLSWCIKNRDKYNINIISMSLSDKTNYTSKNCPDYAIYGSVSNTINEAIKQGISIIAASGNQAYTNGIAFPACLPNVTSIGSITNMDNMAKHSNRYDNLDLLAPGVSIKTTKKGGRFTPGFVLDTICQFSNPSNKFFDISSVCHHGTSYATPHVAGAFALIKQYNPALKPINIEQLLKETGKRIKDDKTGLTFKRIDLISALGVFNWPTFCHDNRRTCYTLLKGDIESEEDSDQFAWPDQKGGDIDSVVLGNVDSHINTDTDSELIVTSVNFNDPEKDGDESGSVYMLDLMYQLDLKTIGISKPVFKQTILTETTGAVYEPGVISELTDNGGKKFVFITETGVVYALDTTSGSYFWDRNINNDYQDSSKAFGAISISDVDNNGTKEIIFADYTGDPDEQAYLYFVNAETGEEVFEPIEIGVKDSSTSGGTHYHLSIADLDGNGYPEIIVPNYYGIYIYEWNGDKIKNFEVCL
jgi:hypothetical protein